MAAQTMSRTEQEAEWVPPSHRVGEYCDDMFTARNRALMFEQKSQQPQSTPSPQELVELRRKEKERKKAEEIERKRREEEERVRREKEQKRIQLEKEKEAKRILMAKKVVESRKAREKEHTRIRRLSITDRSDSFGGQPAPIVRRQSFSRDGSITSPTGKKTFGFSTAPVANKTTPAAKVTTKVTTKATTTATTQQPAHHRSSTVSFGSKPFKRRSSFTIAPPPATGAVKTTTPATSNNNRNTNKDAGVIRSATVSATVKPVEQATTMPEPEKRVPTGNQCHVCFKPVYFMDKLQADNLLLHRWCFRCHQCNSKLSVGSYAGVGGHVYCKPHFKQLFKLKGNYNEGFGTAQRKHDFVNK